MDAGENSQPHGGFRNLLYGDTPDPSLFNLPIEDFIAATQASLQAQGPKFTGDNVQTQAGCPTLNRKDVSSQAVPGTPSREPLRQGQTPINPSVPVYNPALGGQAAFYNVNVGPQSILNTGIQGPLLPHQTAVGPPAPLHNPNLGGQATFYNAGTGPNPVVNRIPNSASQGQSVLFQPRPQSAKRSYNTLGQEEDIRGQKDHPWMRITAGAIGYLPSNQRSASARKRQCLPPPRPQDNTIHKEETNSESRKRRALGFASTNAAPPSNGSSQSSFDKEGSSRGRRDSSTPNTNPKSSEQSRNTFHSRPPFTFSGNATKEDSPQLTMVKKLDMETRATMLSMFSYMYKMLETKCKFEVSESTEPLTQSTSSRRENESMYLLIRIQRQFLEELKTEYRNHEHELLPLTSPLLRGELHDVIGKQQCIMGLAIFPEEFSGILESARRNPRSLVAFPARVLLATKQAWLSREKSWWNSRKEKFENSFREARNRFIGYGLPESILRSP